MRLHQASDSFRAARLQLMRRWGETSSAWTDRRRDRMNATIHQPLLHEADRTAQALAAIADEVEVALRRLR